MFDIYSDPTTTYSKRSGHVGPCFCPRRRINRIFSSVRLKQTNSFNYFITESLSPTILIITYLVQIITDHLNNHNIIWPCSPQTVTIPYAWPSLSQIYLALFLVFGLLSVLVCKLDRRAVNAFVLSLICVIKTASDGKTPSCPLSSPFALLKYMVFLYTCHLWLLYSCAACKANLRRNKSTSLF
jgi:hypothetical protein